MYLTDIGLYNYRSFGNPCILKELKKVNVLIGKNNCGKSNVLRFLSTLNDYTKNISRSLDNKGSLNKDIDLNRETKDNLIKFSINVDLNKFPGLNKYLNIHFPKYNEKFGYTLLIPFKYFFELEKDNYYIKDGNICFDYDLVVDKLLAVYSKEDLMKSEYTDKFMLQRDESEMTLKIYLHTSIVDVFKNNFVTKSQETFKDIILKKNDELTRISKLSSIYIDSHRTVHEEDIRIKDKNIYEIISEIRDPNIENDYLRINYKKLNNFIDFIFNLNNSEVSVNHEKNTIYLTLDGKRLPLSSWGEGVQQTIILGLIIIMNPNKLICIEEPESFLHPEMQKRFIYYINQNTENQYLISTHSNSIFDNDFVQIYHLSKKNGNSIVNQAINDKEKRSILRDLGYKASDILQSNCIIWVEGPSDRIYINKWISEKDKHLIEGIHYSIMFYGGKLLSHLSLDSNEKTLINLSKVNQNAIIVMDSDVDFKKTTLNYTKQRIQSESKSSDNYYWITEGKEIENYINSNLFEKLVNEIHRDYNNKNFDIRYCITKYKPSNNSNYKYIDKVKIAEKITEQWTCIEKDGRGDLDNKISEVVKFIKVVNCM